VTARAVTVLGNTLPSGVRLSVAGVIQFVPFVPSVPIFKLVLFFKIGFLKWQRVGRKCLIL